MTTAAQNVVIQLVDYAQHHDDSELQARIDDTIDVEHRSLVHSLVLILVGMIDHGAAGTWTNIVARLAWNDD